MKYPSSVPFSQNNKSKSPEWLGTLINPKTHKIYNIIQRSNNCYVCTCTPELGIVGSGYLGMGDEKMNLIRSHSPGHPRAYNDDAPDQFSFNYLEALPAEFKPNGVLHKGEALGLLLYCGLSMVANSYNNEGIFSEPDRSAEASAFWKSQRGGIADVVEDEIEEEEYVELDVEEDMLSPYIEDSDASIDSWDPSYIGVNVQISKNVSIDTLPTINVMESGLVLLFNGDELYVDKDYWDPPDFDTLIGLDMEGVTDPGIYQVLLPMLLDLTAPADSQKAVQFMNTWDRVAFQNQRTLQVYRELSGQQKLPLVENKQRGRKRHSRGWKKRFGKLIEAP